MSDNKKWFKVWASLLMDMDFLNLTMEQRGLWLTLGAFVCQQGENGMVRIYPPAKVICLLFNCNDYDALKRVFTPLLQCNVKTALHEDGSLIVTIKNWYKYQRDDSKDRVRKLRAKKYRNVTHQEERRREVTPTSTSPSTPPASRVDLGGRPLAGKKPEEPWQPSTNEPLNEYKPEMATPEEVKQILDRFRNRHGGQT